MKDVPSSSSSAHSNYGSIPANDDLEGNIFRKLSDDSQEHINWPFSASGVISSSTDHADTHNMNNGHEFGRRIGKSRSIGMKLLIMTIVVCSIGLLGVVAYYDNSRSFNLVYRSASQFLESIVGPPVELSSTAEGTMVTIGTSDATEPAVISVSVPAVPTTEPSLSVATIATQKPSHLYEWATPSPTATGYTNSPTAPVPTSVPSVAPTIPVAPTMVVHTMEPTRKSQYSTSSPTNVDGSTPKPSKRSEYWTAFPTSPTAAPTNAPSYSEGDLSYLNPTASPTRRTEFWTARPTNSDGSVPQPTRRSEFASPAPTTGTPSTPPTAEPTSPTPVPTEAPSQGPTIPSVPAMPTMVFGPTTPSPTRKTEYSTETPTLDAETPTAAPVRRTPHPTEQPTDQPTEAPTPLPGEPTLWPTVATPTHWPTKSSLLVTSIPSFSPSAGSDDASLAPTTTRAEEPQVSSPTEESVIAGDEADNQNPNSAIKAVLPSTNAQAPIDSSDASLVSLFPVTK